MKSKLMTVLVSATIVIAAIAGPAARKRRGPEILRAPLLAAFGLFRRDESRQHHGSDSEHEGLFDNYPGELGV